MDNFETRLPAHRLNHALQDWAIGHEPLLGNLADDVVLILIGDQGRPEAVFGTES